jgi:dTDP-4-amino-4,6-dideoxy-D-galactose acyltransferase
VTLSGAASPLIERLAWDSDFFGIEVARLRAGRLDAASLPSAMQALQRSCASLAYVVTDEPIEPAAAARFGLVHRDAKTTYARAIGDGLAAVAGVTVREAQPVEELAQLRALAVASGASSRFMLEERLPAGKAAELYERWMDNSLTGALAAKVLVAVRAGAVVGMVTVGERAGAADIGLIAVDEAARGGGVGGALVAAALAWGRSAGLDQATVVTQGHNRAACALYERCGYAVRDTVQVYHAWL